MKSYTFARISAREYPTLQQLANPHIWGDVQLCINLSEKPYSPEIRAAIEARGVEWHHRPISEESGADWLPAFADALPKLYLAYKAGKKIVVHCYLGNNRSRSLVEALFFAIDHTEFDDSYKGADNHLEYNCLQGHLPDLGEWERRIYAMTELYNKGELDDVRRMSRVLLSKSPGWAVGSFFTFNTKSNPMFRGECATPFFNEVYDAVEDYRNGRPLGDRIIVDEVEITYPDDISNDTICLILQEEIDGFTPVPGHQYKLLLRCFYVSIEPALRYFMLIRILSDKKL